MSADLQAEAAQHPEWTAAQAQLQVSIFHDCCGPVTALFLNVDTALRVVLRLIPCTGC